MTRRLIALSVVFAAATAITAADYVFPSPKPPANINPSTVKQFVSIIFDDNAYSGGTGTQYEPIPNATYATSGWVGGIGQTGAGGANNPLNVTETVNPFGIAWAKSILGAKKNPNGKAIHMTFNVITGLFCPIWGATWQDRQSKFGSYVDAAQPYVAGVSGFLNIPRSWGREMGIGTAQGQTDGQKDAITPMFKSLIAAGYEIGNHTIDHMEANSPLPNNALGFGLWSGEGFDPGVDKNNEGNTILPNEQETYGLLSNSWALTNGWEMDAGKKISTKAWAGAIKLAEDQLKLYLNMQGVGTDLFGFRAPRLETNSNQFFALKQRGYQYDDGLEEGYEDIVDGSNALWPYTLDNGTPNNFVQKDNGEKIYLDSMPAALWEIPLNAMVVPVALRPNVFSKYRQISKGASEPWAMDADSARADSLLWITHGKITGLDFNMFIIWGMTGNEFLQTMVYNLDLHMKNGKAPIQMACHTDYYTPIYDNATLMLPLNKNSYGLNITNGWNTYKDRQKAFEAFIDTAIKRGCYVVSGHELIDSVKALQAKDAPVLPGYALSGTWKFGNNIGTATTTLATATGDSIRATVTFPKAGNDCGYLLPVTKGSLTGLTHISLSYKTTAPIMIRLICGDTTYQALLNNLGPQANSGLIPISAFVLSDKIGYSATVPVATITGIEIAPIAVGPAPPSAVFSVSNLKTYGAKVVTGVKTGPLSAVVAKFALDRVSPMGIAFTAPAAGAYTVALYALNGTLVQSHSVTAQKTGLTHIVFNGKLSPSIYLVKIAGNGRQLTAKSVVSEKI
jgi:hypothetical protein